MSKTEELLGQSVEELYALQEELAKEIFQLTNELTMTRKLDKPHELREKKKERARVLTVLRQKKG